MNRLAKAIGHIQSIRNMVENGRDCSEVLIQLAAVKAAVNNPGKEILKYYLNEVIRDTAETKDDKKMKECNRVIETFRK